MSKRVKCPACAEVFPLPPAVTAGVLTCPSCHARIRMKDRPPGETDHGVREDPPPPRAESRRAADDRPGREDRPRKRKRKKRDQTRAVPVGKVVGIAGGVLGGLVAALVLGWAFSRWGKGSRS